MNKKLQVWLPLLFSVTMIVGMMIGYRMRDTMPGRNFFSMDKSYPLQEVLNLIRNKYVDQVKINDLTDTAVSAILSKLDPHSVFISAEEVEGVNEDIAGNFFGIGVEFDVLEDTINVLNVVPDGPSFKAGIQTGDKFIKVNDTVIAGRKLSTESIKKLLRGGGGSKVVVEILRGVEHKSFTITRGIIPVSSVDAAYIMTNDIGYIRLNKFSQVTYREFMQKLEDLQKQGLKKLILDLRGNGGGVLDQATEVADEFLDGDKLITYTEGSHFPKKEYRCKRQGLFETGQLVVLSDEGTASASEILIGALQDWNRATIIGRRTFGKGLVQEQYDLSDGSALRLTVARYFTPVGRSIQRPYTNGGKAYYDEITMRFHDGEMVNADSLKNDTTKVFKTQNGKIVYGGGGITPDIFVAFDTSSSAAVSMSKLYYKGSIGEFAYKYYLKNQASLKGYKTAADFAGNFNLPEEDWAFFKQQVKKDSINLENISQKEKNELTTRVKSSIARQLWRNQGYYQSINTQDDVIKKAMEILVK
jgi:carboxyl-terminal processing protease